MPDRADRKDRLLEAGLILASELSLPIVLQRIVDLATQVTDARYGALGVLGAERVLVEFVTSGISRAQRKAIGALPRGNGVLGLLIDEPTPVRLKNIADHPRSVGFPAHHPAMRSFLGAPVKALGKVYGNIYLAEKRGADEFSAEDEEALVVLATQAGVAIANASLYEEAQLREQWLDALRDITNDILAGVEESSLLESIASHARDLAGADAATIVSVTGTTDELAVTVAVGAHAPALRGLVLPAQASISGEVMRSGTTLVLDDVSTEPRAHQPTARAGRHGPVVLVPLRVRGGSSGVLVVANLKGHPRFDTRTVRLVEIFADQASVAIEYRRAQVELRRLGLMEERERIAQDMHDGIIQSLFAVGMSLQATAQRAGSRETAERVESAVTELDRVIRDLRNYIFGLRPGILADTQLDKALRSLGHDVSDRTGLAVAIEVDGNVAAALSSRSHDIVQLTREALSNVSRHAQAKHATVRLARSGTRAVLAIEDDGVGFDTAADSSGNGLRNMRSRASALGGRLSVTSAPGKGTRVRVTFKV